MLRNALTPPGVFEPDPGNALAGPPSLADAWDVTAPALRRNAADTWAAAKDPQFWQDAVEQYRNALLMGSVAPTMKGLGLDAAATKVLQDMSPGFRAYHGSPHSFDRFDYRKIGTGEGNQVYGHGLYFAEAEPVAQGYRDRLSGALGMMVQPAAPQAAKDALKMAAARTSETTLDGAISDLAAKRDAAMINAQNAYELGLSPGDADRLAGRYQQVGHHFQDLLDGLHDHREHFAPGTGNMYQVNIATNPEHMLDWDKPMSEHSPHVQDVMRKLGVYRPGKNDDLTGGGAYGILESLSPGAATQEEYAAGVNRAYNASKALRDAGIPGLRYLDQDSRAAGSGSRNTVLFDDKAIEILRKYGIAGLMAGGGAAAGVNSGNSE